MIKISLPSYVIKLCNDKNISTINVATEHGDLRERAADRGGAGQAGGHRGYPGGAGGGHGAGRGPQLPSAPAHQGRARRLHLLEPRVQNIPQEAAALSQ